ncbi:MAG: fibronectin type III domain-containing protein [Roseburia sp. 1XD42-69]|jgi:Fibronectin type III domain.
MRKNVMKKVITLLMALIVMVTAVPTGNVTAQAAVKPGSVSKVKVSKVTKNSAKVTYKKAKKAKGYQIRVYKGRKQVLSKKTKALSYNIKKLKPNTKYTVKVRAFNGKKYGKEKFVKFKTKKNTTKNPTPAPTPDPEQETETESSTPTPSPSEPVRPGQSTSEGEQLVAEYNAYVAYIAADWGNWANVAKAMCDPSVTCLNSSWLKYTGMMYGSWTYSEMYTDKYQAYKHGCGTLDAITDYYADVLTACGLTVTVNTIDPKEYYDRYNQLFAYDANYKNYYEPRIHKAITVMTQDGKTHTEVVIFAASGNGFSGASVDPSNLKDGRTILWTCPGCKNEIHTWCGLDTIQNWQTWKETEAYCDHCKKRYTITNPYYNTDLTQPVYIRTATVISE